MTFQELAQRAEKKKPGRMDIAGRADAAVVQVWEKKGWNVVRHGEQTEAAVEAAVKGQTNLLCFFSPEPLKTICAIEKLLPRENGALVWMHGIEVPAYSKLLWAGAAPSAHYGNIPEALKAVQLMIHALNGFGYAEPRVALLSCVEAISPGVPSTIWEAVLGHMGTRGQFGKAKVDGPLAFDLAVSPRAAEDKKFQSVVGAQADLIVPPDLNSFLSLCQALFLTGPQEAADVVVGGPCPIVLAAPGLQSHAEHSLAAASLLV